MKWVVRHGEENREVEIARNGSSFSVDIDGLTREVELVPFDGSVASLRLLPDGESFRITYRRGSNGSWWVGVGEREFSLDLLTPTEATESLATARDSGPSRITAPIPGRVVSIKVASGDEVQPGQSLVVLEAMKMENELAAEQSGRVVEIHVSEGDTVDGGQLLVELE